MNIITILITALAICCTPIHCMAETDGMDTALIRNLDLNDLSPTSALAKLHDSWADAIRPSSPPSFLLAGNTNGITMSGDFTAEAITPQEALQLYCEVANLRYTIYTNGIVFFPVPVYSTGQILGKQIDVTPEAAALLGLGDGRQEHVEERLRTFGLNFPQAGCEARYDAVKQSLLISHVPNEILKAIFLMKQASQGVAIDDVAIDPTLHISSIYLSYENGTWTKHKNDNQAQQAGPGYPPQGVGSPDP